MRNFVYTSHPSRIVFGTGTVGQVREEVERLGCSRVLLLSTPSVAKAAAQVRDVLGDVVVAEFDGATMHTPVEVTERALDVLREHSADCLVAVGGGSTTGLAKALALRTDLPQLILPTTYAGSEVTPVLGETQNGRKTTVASPAILPETVVYDVEFTLGLPVGLSVTSAVNAMAHAVEALYAPQANPVIDAMALDAIALSARALPALVAEPSDTAARADLLRAAWLAGTCLGSVGMGLHHKLCHTLGGAFDLPHAATHTVILPHAMAYNAPAARDAMSRIAGALGVPDAPSGMFDLITSLGAPPRCASWAWRRRICRRPRGWRSPRRTPTPGADAHGNREPVARRPGGAAVRRFPRHRLLLREPLDWWPPRRTEWRRTWSA
ncbi:maleylacetate reductase [Streptomyces mirabilis]|nr:maleylacetate reductase [Streptomyces mirabilis]